MVWKKGKIKNIQPLSSNKISKKGMENIQPFLYFQYFPLDKTLKCLP